METGTSLLLIATGAILRFAVTAHVSGVSIHTVGTILIIIGVVGLVLSLFFLAAWRERRAVPAAPVAVREDPVVRERY
jgi:hypothetical protein